MDRQKTTFALFFGNRGFFPASLMDGARQEIPRVLREMGHEVLMMDAAATAHGGVETPVEARKYAAFLKANRGKYGGVILSLPNFGDENGAAIALKEAGVPIFIQAYPDEMDKLAPAFRRDSFCGKLSIMDVLKQHGIAFTVDKPHVVSPSSPSFRASIDAFDRVCRIVNGLPNTVVGAIGARTTPFKTVRIDELTLQKYGITVETFDLSQVFDGMKRLRTNANSYKAKLAHLQGLTAWRGVPEHALDHLVRLGVVLDTMIEENGLHALSIRCWTELQLQFGISPCLVTSDLMDHGIPAACEVDTGSAIAMRMLGLASGNPTTILDWNNNYGDDPEKCILFHCGNVPPSLMADKGRITDHEILKNTVGEGRGFGCNSGRIAPADFTFSNLLTEDGRIRVYVGQGRFTDDDIPREFFGCAGVARVGGLQDVLLYLGRTGHRHHVTATTAQVQQPIVEALRTYLHYDLDIPQEAAS